MKDFLMKRNRKGLKGFTLIELLVVIGIILILAGITVPIIGKAITTAHKLRCQSNLRALYHGIFLYDTNFHGYPQGDDYRGAKFWGVLRTMPSPESSILIEEQGSKAHGYFVCPLSGSVPGPGVCDYRGPGYDAGQRTKGATVLGADKTDNHDPEGKGDINILFFGGQIDSYRPDSPEWADADNRLRD
ncbi:MAG: prepilin-type N-terminal cleavage/methylation domain-containing protein [Candidatus Brocadiia bacterium]